MTYSDSKAGTWQLHEAKARFSELFRLARTAGAQRVTRHGAETVVIVAAEEFDRLQNRASQPDSLVKFFQAAPAGASDLDLVRKRDTTRDITW